MPSTTTDRYEVALLSRIGCHSVLDFDTADEIADRYSTGTSRVEIRLACAAASRDGHREIVKVAGGLKVEIRALVGSAV